MISREAIIQAFRARNETAPLVELKRPHVPGFPTVAYFEPSTELKHELGKFAILVWDRTVGPDDWANISGPDTDGVYWQRSYPERGPGGPEWIARKLYGKNVELRWWDPVRKVDSRWHQLDLLLTRVS